jgi:transcriptional regulator GlxA family with amidase domain
MDALLAELLPTARQASEASTELAELARSEGGIVRAEQLASIAAVSLRTLERRFRTHVGLSPKKAIQRYRLQAVAERALSDDIDWASVAAELGYADQAHLSRDFRAVTGEAPASYSRTERVFNASHRGSRHSRAEAIVIASTFRLLLDKPGHERL